MNSPTTFSETNTAWIAGIDLSLEEQRPDGLCLIFAAGHSATIVKTDLASGDDALVTWIKNNVSNTDQTLLCIDAPLVVPNALGCRPAEGNFDLELTRHHAGDYSTDATKNDRPVRVAQMLQKNGYPLGYDLAQASRMTADVYPHPAMMRLFELDFIIKYKKGTLQAKKQEFRRLQFLLRECIMTHFSELQVMEPIETLFGESWSRDAETQMDALFCALIGYFHWKHREHLGQIEGSEQSFVLLPPRFRNGVILMGAEGAGRPAAMELASSEAQS